jgi:hypothetical protein
MPERIVLYSLCCAWSGVRYVGASRADLRTRLAKHVEDALAGRTDSSLAKTIRATRDPAYLYISELECLPADTPPTEVRARCAMWCLRTRAVPANARERWRA